MSFPAPKAWPQMGSMPMERPERMEYPVMFAKPMASEPPARESSPRWPRKSMEIMEREYSNIPVRIIGIAIRAIAIASIMAKDR